MGHEHEIRLSIGRWESISSRHCQRFGDHIGHEPYDGEWIKNEEGVGEFSEWNDERKLCWTLLECWKLLSYESNEGQERLRSYKIETLMKLIQALKESNINKNWKRKKENVEWSFNKLNLNYIKWQ